MNTLVTISGHAKLLADQRVIQSIELRNSRLRLELKALHGDLALRGITFSSGVAIDSFHKLACNTLEDMIWDAWLGLRDILRGISIETPTGLAQEIQQYLKPQTDHLERVALGIVYENGTVGVALKKMNQAERSALDEAFHDALRHRKSAVWARVCTDAGLLEAELSKQHQAVERTEKRADRRTIYAAAVTVILTVALTWVLQCNRDEKVNPNVSPNNASPVSSH